jgi:hypothetical protein
MGTIDLDSPDYLPFPMILAVLPRPFVIYLLAASIAAAALEHDKHHPHSHVEESESTPVLPLYVTAQTTDVTVPLTGVSATGSVGSLRAGVLPPMETPPAELPHTHDEREDPPPPASHFDIVTSTGAGPGPLGWLGGNSQDVANDVIRRNWERQRRAHYVMASTSSTMSPALMEFVSRQAASPST